MKLSMWKRRPKLVAVEYTQVDWPSSVHKLKNHILHVIGGDVKVQTEPVDEENGPGTPCCNNKIRSNP